MIMHPTLYNERRKSLHVFTSLKAFAVRKNLSSVSMFAYLSVNDTSDGGARKR